MKELQDKIRMSIKGLPMDASQEEFMKAFHAAFSALGFPPSDKDVLIANNYLKNRNKIPAKDTKEDWADYFQRLFNRWGKAREIAETHNRWKAKHPNGLLEYDFMQRICRHLMELLESGFLRIDYIDTGLPDEDCRNARQWLEKYKWGNLLEEVEGAEWKCALMIRHLKKRTEQFLVFDENNVGFYIEDMREKLSWDDVEAFFRFYTSMQLILEDVNQLRNKKSTESEDLDEDKEKTKAAEEFVKKICKLADVVFEKCNGISVNLGGKKGFTTVTIKGKELKAYMDEYKKNHIDELLSMCYPPSSGDKKKLCEFVGSLYKKGYFGTLPKSRLAEHMSPIVGLGIGYIQGLLK